MIPKIIHNCRFGRGPKSELGKVCIAARKKYLPDYEFGEWNKGTFDLKPFIKLAHEKKKALVVERFTYQKGFCFLTDVHLHGPVKDFKKIYENCSIVSLNSGFKSYSLSDSMKKWVNPFEELEKLIAA